MLHKLMKIMHERNGNFIKETENLKKDQTEFGELKNAKLKTSSEGFNHRPD